ncbi:acyltransferase family protein [Aquamicrobium ahrensii]|uniref:Peptidoglycan/LPS O-acetylase OafA/YrhL n=1 Tax=Aquamicrobium ahrensii TaxID=469551 RepID=A0ABV2KS41_9HYPH
MTSRGESAPFFLARAAKRGANSYGVIRVIAAVLVIWTHSYAVVRGADAWEPLRDLTGYSLGSHAVNIFFSLSGFMVASSWARSRDVADFALARILRIMPALVCVCGAIVIVSGLFLTNVSAGEYWTVANIGPFLARSLLIFSSETTLAGVFQDNPWPGVLNLPIWTIRYEVICYVSLIIFMLALGFLKVGVVTRRLLLATILGVSCVLLLLPEMTGHNELVARLARLFFAFYLGVTAWFERDRIKLSFPWLLAIWIPLAFCLASGSLLKLPLGMVAVAYLSFWLGSFQAGRLQDAADRTDLSYGIYVWGFFLQQCLIQFFPGQGVFANAISATFLAALFAWFSWTLVERPALNLRFRLRRRGSDTTQATEMHVQGVSGRRALQPDETS